MVFGDGDGRNVRLVRIDGRDFLQDLTVDVNDTLFDFDGVARESDDSLDPGLAAVPGIEEGDEFVASR